MKFHKYFIAKSTKKFNFFIQVILNIAVYINLSVLNFYKVYIKTCSIGHDKFN